MLRRVSPSIRSAGEEAYTYAAMTAEFPFDFATLLNSAEWLAPGLEWINNVNPDPASAAPAPMTLPIPVPMASHAQLALPPLMAPGPTPVATPMMGGDDGLPPMPPMPASAPGGTTTRLWF